MTMKNKQHYSANQIRLAKIKALDDIAKLEGTGKYNTPANICYADGYFANSLLREYNVSSISELKKWAKS